MGRKRLIGLTITLLAVSITALVLQWVRNQLGDESTFTGWTLLTATMGLYLLTARKRMIARRLGPVAAWLQVHMYMGTFASIVFLMHIGWPVRGLFESFLAACFVVVAVSGIALGLLSRSTPRKLAAIEGDYLLERIPALRANVAGDAHNTAISSAGFGEGATLAEFYQRRLLPFFQSPRGLLYQLIPNGFARRQLLRELNDLDRYLAEQGNASRLRLIHLVKSKDDLDYHQALQTRLRLFFAAHVALTWALALMIGVHVVLVYRFQGVML
ncbi:MAG: hypothetical protein R3C53_16100 [Pirellulaceae bacterium]